MIYSLLTLKFSQKVYDLYFTGEWYHLELEEPFFFFLMTVSLESKVKRSLFTD